MSHTVTQGCLSRRVPRCLPVLIAVAVAATVVTRYTVYNCSDSFGNRAGNGTTAVAAFAAHTSSPTSALRVVALNAVPLDYTFTYEVYRSRGYELCPPALHRGYLHLHRPVDCLTLFKEVLADQTRNLLATPPQFVPSIYRNEYLLDGHVELQSRPVSEVYNGNPKPLEWSQGYLDNMVARAGRREHLSYGEWANSLYNALASVDITEQRGLVVGSETPWVEAAALHAGAANITTSEYRKIVSGHDRHTAYHPREQAQHFLEGKLQPYDFAISYSSLEHSGLGRYGDPLDPNGDLTETAKLSCLVKPGGLLFLGLPINSDAVVFNSHRLYGPVRLPLMTANWAVHGIFGKDRASPVEDLTPFFYNDARDDWILQLVIVARNNRDTPCLVYSSQ